MKRKAATCGVAGLYLVSQLSLIPILLEGETSWKKVEKVAFIVLMGLVFLVLGLGIILYSGLDQKKMEQRCLQRIQMNLNEVENINRRFRIPLEQLYPQPRNSIDSGVGVSRASSILGNGDDDSGISGFDVSIV